MRKITILQVVLILSAAIVFTVKTGEGGTLFEQVEIQSDYRLKSGIHITGFEGSKALVEFETQKKTPAAVAYYGGLMSNEEVRLPRYRITSREALPQGIMNTHKHRIMLDISRLESYSYDPGLIKNKGGVIVYRIEIFDPSINTTRIYNRRQCYKRQGPPKTGAYSLCTTLTEGPFIDIITSDSAVVSWETDKPDSGSVVINGKELKSNSTSTRHEILPANLQPDTQYTYYVKYSGDGSVTPPCSFKTAPLVGSRQPFKFGFMSDSRGGVGGGERSINGVNYKVLSHFSSELYNKNVNLILFGGDLINGYTSDSKDFMSQLKTWKEAIEPVGAYIPFYEIMGNHEQTGPYYKIPDPDQKGTFFLAYTDGERKESAEVIFAREFVNPLGSSYNLSIPEPENRIAGTGGSEKGPQYTENVYSFNYGNTHFIALNTNYWHTGQRPYKDNTRSYADKKGTALALKHLGGNREGYIRDNQLKWLERDLKAAEEDNNISWVFIYLHEPPLPNGGHLQDAMFWGTPGKGQQGGYNDHSAPLGDVIDMRNRFLKIISRHQKVVALLAGDEHNYSRTLIDNTICTACQNPVWQIISGGVGAPYYVQDRSVPWVHNVKSFAPSKNYCIFSVEDNRVGLAVYSDTDQILDKVEDLTIIKK